MVVLRCTRKLLVRLKQVGDLPPVESKLLAYHQLIMANAGAIEPLLLGYDEAHVWRAGLDRSESSLALGWGVLTDDERDRASHYVFERDRRRFIAGRALLRTLLVRYTGIPAAAISLRTGTNSKPMLDPGLRIEFNVSHSNEAVMYVFARHPVGVDVEYVRPMPEALDLACRFFSRREMCALRMLSERELVDGFFRCWTRKEAYVKARGDGIGFPLDSFSVSLDSEQPALLACDLDPAETQRWTLRNLTVSPGYIAALAMSANVRHVVERSVDETPRENSSARIAKPTRSESD